MMILKEIKKVYDAAGNDKQMSCALEKLNEMRVLHAKNARLQKVLQQDGVCMLLATRFLRLGPHFRRRHKFKVTWLAKAIDVNMGVSRSLEISCEC
jgi:tRNA/tmRNA/rRNA uracil-C5-methylase (TrmA/RlmC/RlmD family)